MIVLMVAAEFAPYAEAGVAGRTAAALSRALVQLGHDVTVVVPNHPGFADQGMMLARRLTPLPLADGGSAMLFDGQLSSGVKLVLIDGPGFFARSGVYADQEPGTVAGADYVDNADRFSFFAQAVTALFQQRRVQGQAFELVHAFDWPGAFALLMLKAEEPALRSVLTLHEGHSSGELGIELARKMVPKEFLTLGTTPGSNEFSVLKAGIQVADQVTLPSPTIAQDLLDESKYGALAVTLARRADSTVSVMCGADYAVYNPATDANIPARFDAEHASNKGTCRTVVLREERLDLDPDRPLIVVNIEPSFVSQLEALSAILPQLIKSGSLIIVSVPYGVSRPEIDRSRAEGQVAIVNSSPTLERRLLSAADISLCLDPYTIDAGAIRKAQRYGAVPIALARGAARDAIVDADSALETGTGFLCRSENDLLGALQRAISAFALPSWVQLRRRVMRLDLAWDRAAHRYVKLYRQILSN